MSETTRTILLLLLLGIIIGFVFWTRYNYNVNFETFLE